MTPPRVNVVSIGKLISTCEISVEKLTTGLVTAKLKYITFDPAEGDRVEGDSFFVCLLSVQARGNHGL